MAGSLSTEQTDAFWNDGFLFPVAAISTADALAARQHFLELMDEPAVTLPRPANDYARSCFHTVSTEAARLAAHPAILDAVESLLGPDLLVWSVEIIIKPPQSDKMLTMHQDLNYCGASSTPMVRSPPGWHSVTSPSRTGRCSSCVPAIALAPSLTTTRMAGTTC
jgi:hypothetical protein